MRLLAPVLAAVLLSSLPASATILIYDGPAPAKEYGSAERVRRNKTYFVLDTVTSRAQLVNFFGRRKTKDFDVVGPIPMDSAVIAGSRGSQTAATGILRTEPEPSGFDTIAISIRGKNAVLDRSPDLISPRALTGIFRRTLKTSQEVSHFEQRFQVRYNRVLSNASNTNEETLEEAVERVKTVLENKGYED